MACHRPTVGTRNRRQEIKLSKPTLPAPRRQVAEIDLTPRPMAMHIALQTLTWMICVSALPAWRTGSPALNPPLRRAERNLAERLAAVDTDDLRGAIEREASRRLHDFAAGVERYHAAPRPGRPGTTPVLWREGTTRLLDYGSADRADAPLLLLIPSLVNRAHILDLDERLSLARGLAGRGFRPLLVEWNEPGAIERKFGFDDYIAGRLGRALDAVVAATGRRPVLIGYCMGGNLALALAALRPDHVTALALLATPWDFHAMPVTSTRALAALMPSIDAALDVLGELPVDALQAMFAGLDPYLTARKFRRFAHNSGDSDAAFVALEDWLNDGVPLVGRVARACLGEWYVENRPGLGTWRVDGRVIDPANIQMPALVVVPARDHIVPPASARPLAAALPRAELLEVAAGHIGMVAGSAAQTLLQAPLAAWLDTVVRAGGTAPD